MALTSAGVEIKEIDLTNVVPALATSLGGYAGSFNWGPAGVLVNVSSEKDLIRLFGAPNNTNTLQTASFFTAASFLKYGNSLKVSRSVEVTDYNAASPYLSGASAYTPYAATLIKNKDVFDAIIGTNTLKSAIVARYAGSLGNALKVVICRASALAAGGTGVTLRTDATLFSYAPGTSTFAAAVKAANASLTSANMDDEIHVAVIDSDGSFTGTAGTILEKYEGL
jgi:hypothetical protein